MGINFNSGLGTDQMRRLLATQKTDSPEQVGAAQSGGEATNIPSTQAASDDSENSLNKLELIGKEQFSILSWKARLESNPDVQDLMSLMGATFDIGQRVTNFSISKKTGEITYTSGSTTYVYNPEEKTLSKSVTGKSEKFPNGVVTEYNEWNVDTSKNPPEKELSFRINNKNGEAAGVTVKNGTLVYEDGTEVPRGKAKSMYTHPDGSVDVVRDNSKNSMKDIKNLINILKPLNEPEDGEKLLVNVSYNYPQTVNEETGEVTTTYTCESIKKAHQQAVDATKRILANELTKLMGADFEADEPIDRFTFDKNLETVSFTSNGVTYSYNYYTKTLDKTVLDKDNNIKEFDSWSVDKGEKTLTKRIVNNSDAITLTLGEDGKFHVAGLPEENTAAFETALNTSTSFYIAADGKLTRTDKEGTQYFNNIEGFMNPESRSMWLKLKIIQDDEVPATETPEEAEIIQEELEE